jgi:hypothetical protein
MLPRIAHKARSAALVSKLLCVKSRWKPTVIPEREGILDRQRDELGAFDAPRRLRHGRARW